MSAEFDLHSHTNAGLYPEAVRYSPQDLVKHAADVGLAGIAVTDHDTVAGVDAAMNEAARLGVVVVPGIEITTFAPVHFPHILALGITPETVSRAGGIPTLQSPRRAVSWIRDHGGIAVAVHPFPYRHYFALSYAEVRANAHAFDAVETVNTRGFNPVADGIARAAGLARLGSSDSHMLAQVGLVRTDISGDTGTWENVIDRIRDGNTEPVMKFTVRAELRDHGGLRMFIRRLFSYR